MASKYWVGGGTNTNWSSSPTTNWANTDGGAGNQTAPTTGDSVYFTASRGSGAAVWDTAISLATLDCTGSKNTISGNVAFTISSGNLVLPTGVGAAYTSTSTFTFTGTSGTQQITSHGFTVRTLTFNGSGGTFQTQDNLLMDTGGGGITLTTGTFDTQTYTVSTPYFASTGAATRAVQGSGAWTVGTGNVTGNVWNVTASLTTTSFSSSISYAASAASAGRVFAGAGKTYSGGISFGATSTTGVIHVTGANTFGSLSISAPNTIQFASGVTQTISTAFTIAGSAGSYILLAQDNLNNTTQWTLSVASGTATFAYCALQNLACTGGATFTASNSWDLEGNSGVTITAPGGGGISRSRIQTGM